VLNCAHLDVQEKPMWRAFLTRLPAGFVLLLAAFTTSLVAQSVACTPDKALLSTSDPAYADAMELQQRLEKHDFTIRCIFPTKFGSVFMVDQNGVLQSTVEGEACFSTNYGGIDVVFLPKAQTFAGFKITEHREGGGFLYRFTGTPRVAAGEKFKFGTATRQYFLKHGNYLIIVSTNQLVARLEDAFGHLSTP
jgi:hypothetical protein